MTTRAALKKSSLQLLALQSERILKKEIRLLKQSEHKVDVEHVFLASSSTHTVECLSKEINPLNQSLRDTTALEEQKAHVSAFNTKHRNDQDRSTGTRVHNNQGKQKHKEISGKNGLQVSKSKKISRREEQQIQKVGSIKKGHQNESGARCNQISHILERSGDNEGSKGKNVCSACGSSITPLWRLIHGSMVCNACGLRYKRKGVFTASRSSQRKRLVGDQNPKECSDLKTNKKRTFTEFEAKNANIKRKKVCPSRGDRQIATKGMVNSLHPESYHEDQMEMLPLIQHLLEATDEVKLDGTKTKYEFRSLPTEHYSNQILKSTLNDSGSSSDSDSDSSSATVSPERMKMISFTDKKKEVDCEDVVNDPMLAQQLHLQALQKTYSYTSERDASPICPGKIYNRTMLPGNCTPQKYFMYTEYYSPSNTMEKGNRNIHGSGCELRKDFNSIKPLDGLSTSCRTVMHTHSDGIIAGCKKRGKLFRKAKIEGCRRELKSIKKKIKKIDEEIKRRNHNIFDSCKIVPTCSDYRDFTDILYDSTTIAHQAQDPTFLLNEDSNFHVLYRSTSSFLTI